MKKLAAVVVIHMICALLARAAATDTTRAGAAVSSRSGKNGDPSASSWRNEGGMVFNANLLSAGARLTYTFHIPDPNLYRNMSNLRIEVYGKGKSGLFSAGEPTVFVGDHSLRNVSPHSGANVFTIPVSRLRRPPSGETPLTGYLLDVSLKFGITDWYDIKYVKIKYSFNGMDQDDLRRFQVMLDASSALKRFYYVTDFVSTDTVLPRLMVNTIKTANAERVLTAVMPGMSTVLGTVNPLVGAVLDGYGLLELYHALKGTFRDILDWSDFDNSTDGQRFDRKSWTAYANMVSLANAWEDALNRSGQVGNEAGAHLLSAQDALGKLQRKIEEAGDKYRGALSDSTPGVVSCARRALAVISPMVRHNLTTGDKQGSYLEKLSDFLQPIVLPDVTIYGYVRTPPGAGLRGVTVTADRGGGSDVTSSSGYYEFTVPYGWGGSITPNISNSKYSFRPYNRSRYNGLIRDLELNFTAYEYGFDYDLIENGRAVRIIEYVGNEAHLDIPGTLGGKPVKEIGDRAFYDFYGLTRITLPDSVTHIGDGAFSRCRQLTQITLPDSVTHIGDRAFSDCYRLTQFIVNPGNTRYSSQDGVLFSRDRSDLVRYPENKSGASYTIPDSVTHIGDYAFYDCDGLTRITLPDSAVTHIGDYAFYRCDRLTQITLPDSVTHIGDYAFSDCDGLTRITLPDSAVTHIGDYAFSDCDGLTRITLPDSVTHIGDRAFSDCDRLTQFIVNPGNTRYSSQDGVLFSRDRSDLVRYPENKSGASYTIPDSVTHIGDYAFYRCDRLTQITLPASVTHIGDYAFYRCDGLTRITLPDSVTHIGDYAFSYCELTELTLPDSLTKIGDHAFYRCSGLTELTLPDSVTHIGDRTFSGCRGLTQITLPDSVTHIGDGAFSGCRGLTQITLPDSVTHIGDRTFSGCRGLTQITLPDSVTHIGDGAFSGCRGLTQITLPDSVTHIGDYAFSDCDGLTQITLPDSVTHIGDLAFFGCEGLTQIEVHSNNTHFSSQNGVLFNKEKTRLWQYPAGKSDSYTLPDSVTHIGDGAFSYCYRLTEFTLPDSVTHIGDGAFYDCEGLTQITLPDSVTHIGDWAFSYCRLTDALFEGDAPTMGVRGRVFDYVAVGFKVQFYEGASGFTTPVWKGYRSESRPRTENAFTYRFINNGEAAQIIGYTGSAADLIIPDTLGGKPVKEIGSSAFERNSTLQSVSFPDSLPEIGSRAFSGCSGLTELTLPDSLTVIGDHAFSGCIGLTELTLPDSLTVIGVAAFYGCIGLTNALFEGDAPSTVGSRIFDRTASEFKVQFYEGASGFTTPTWKGYPSERYGTLSFLTWRSRFRFGAGDLTAANGEPLLIAYALNMDPANPAARLPIPVMEGGKIRLHFPIMAERPDVLLQVERSTNMLSGVWEAAEVETNSGMGSFSMPLSGSPDKLYLRFTAESEATPF